MQIETTLRMIGTEKQLLSLTRHSLIKKAQFNRELPQPNKMYAIWGQVSSKRVIVFYYYYNLLYKSHESVLCSVIGQRFTSKGEVKETQKTWESAPIKEFYEKSPKRVRTRKLAIYLLRDKLGYIPSKKEMFQSMEKNLKSFLNKNKEKLWIKNQEY